MTDEVVHGVRSIQKNENGVVAEVAGTCLPNGTIRFLATLLDGDGKPTVNVVGGKNLDGQPIPGAASVRYRVNDTVRVGSIPSTEFRNTFAILTINGRAVIDARKAQDDTSATVSQALALAQVLGGGALALSGSDYDQVWGALIEFETNKGNLIVSIPVFHPAIQQLYQKCFANSGAE